MRLLLNALDASLSHQASQHRRNPVGTTIGRERVARVPLGFQRKGHHSLACKAIREAESVRLRPAQNSAWSQDAHGLLHQYRPVIPVKDVDEKARVD